MELFYTPTSPYARKIRLAADHLGLAHRMALTVIPPLGETADRLAAINPLGKIPVLRLENGEIIYDSPVIADVLFHLAEAPVPTFEDRLKQQKMQALADGIMDAAVLLQMENSRDEIRRSSFWQKRWQAAILRSVAAFDKSMIQSAGEWHIGSMSMACALDYLRFRHGDLNWIDGNAAADHWYQKIMAKDIMVATDPEGA